MDCGGNFWSLQIWGEEGALEIGNYTPKALAAGGGGGRELMDT